MARKTKRSPSGNDNRILWISNSHNPSREQISELKSLFGRDTYIELYKELITSGDEVVKLYREGNYKELVVVLPNKMISEIVARGEHPIRPLMKKVKGLNGIEYEHVGFARVIKHEYQEVILRG